jgi:fido (protein-threonine AMPylation protein)
MSNIAIFSRKVNDVKHNIKLNQCNNLIQDYESIWDWLMSTYIHDIWKGEQRIKLKNKYSIELVDNVYLQETKLINQSLKVCNFNNSSKTIQKIQNIHKAAQYVFNCHQNTKLDFKFVTHLHCIIGKDVIHNAGKLRQVEVKPAGSNLIYMKPKYIKNELIKLLDTTSNLCQHINNDITKCVAIGSVFFSEFLLIHPFSNGNGRTARLLFNFIIRSIIPIPFTPGSHNLNYSKDNDLYLSVLEQRNDKICSPINLGIYISNSLYRTCDNINYLMLH